MANREPQDTLEGRLMLWAADWLTVLLLSVGTVFPCLDAYGVSGAYGFDLGAVLAFCVFGSLCVSAMFTWRHEYWAALALLAIEGLILWRLWKRMTEDWILGRPPQLFDLTGAYPGTLFLLYALAILLLGWIVVRVRAWWLAAALAVLPLLPAFQRGVLPSWGAMLAGFVGWGGMLLTGLFDRKDPGSLGRARLLSLAGMTALVGVLVMSLPMEGYVRPQWATNARNSLIRSVTRQMERFFDLETVEGGLLADLGLDLSVPGEEAGSGSGPGNGPGTVDAASGGGSGERENLLFAGPRHYLGRRVMTVRTDQPDPAGRIYLRGTSFDTYTGASWEHGGALEDFAGAALFPARTAPEAAEYALYIRNTASNSLLFYPYRFTGGGETDEPGRITGLDDGRGTPLLPEEMLSQRQNEYSVTYRPGGPEDGFTPLGGSAAAVEWGYRYGTVDFEQAYLRVSSPDALLTLEPVLEDVQKVPVTVDERLPEQFRAAVAAAARTAGYLASAAEYDPNTPAMGADEDFVTHFLEEGRGFCVHFATAGTLLLRMQGVPARYVTGYVAQLDSQGRGDVMDSDAHAWVEIYLDGYGWYPVEMTPGYTGGVSGVGLEGVPDEPAGSESDPEDEDLPPEEEDLPEEETPDPEVSDEQLPEDGEHPGEEEPEAKGVAAFWKALFGIAVFWALFCAAYLLALLVRRQARKDKNANRSVLNAYGRYKRLRRWGCGQDDELERLANKAKFSQYTLTKEERETAWKCLDENVKQSRIGQPVRRRWLLALLCPIF